MKRVNYVCLILMGLIVCIFYNRAYALEQEVESLNVQLESAEEDKEELRDKLTEVELEYDNLSHEYYSELVGRLNTEKEVEDLQIVIENKSKEDYNYMYSLEEVNLLARCCSAEAGSMNYESQKGIAQVILNRVESSKFPNSIESVIYQEGQFTVVDIGAINKQASSQTIQNVIDVILHGYEFPSDVLYFHSERAGSKNAYECIEGTAFFKSN